MKLKVVFAFLIAFVGLFLFSCNNEGAMRKNITGTAGDLVIVVSDESWNGKPGDLLRETFSQDHVALPQDEPIFDVIRVPKQGFKSIFKSTRNILQVNISSNLDTTGVSFQDDVWAYPQATVIINAGNPEEFEQLFNQNKNKILSYFLKAEQERLTMNYNKFYEKGIYNVLNENFDLTMKVPPGFVIAEQKKDFIWLKYETPEISQGIIIYSFPYVSDSAFTESYLIRVRDSVLKANVPGPSEGSYMATERRVDQMQNYLTHNGNYASEMRGLWRVRNDFMGGPYVSLAVLDAANQRVIVAFGYVYAPSKEKRNFLRQVQAMVYSLKLNSQAENDKITSEMKAAAE